MCVRVSSIMQNRHCNICTSSSISVGIAAQRGVCRCLLTCLSIVAWHIPVCRARTCADVVLTTSAGVAQILELDCQSFIRSQGVSEIFLAPSNNPIDAWPFCSELQPDLQNVFATHNCSCPPGFSDMTYGKNGLGLLVGLKNIDIARISCQHKCAPAYNNIFRSPHVDACACWNRRGCVFEDRTLLRLTPPEQYTQPGIIMLPDSLLYDSSLIRCRQSFCAQSVSPHDIIVCAERGIEYTYCNECPSECLQPHRTCVIDPITRFCNVLCDSGYIRVFSSERAEYDCTLRKVCELHHYSNVSSHAHGGFFEQTCVPCARGTDNANAYVRGCLPCAAGKTNYAAGAVCDFCVEDAVVLPGSNLCTPCSLLDPDRSVRRGATNCSDTICRPSVSSFRSNCLSLVEKNTLSNCRHAGFGLNSAGQCGMCARNYAPMNVSDTIVFPGTNSVPIWYHHCQECPPHHYTADVGMTECIPCPAFHVRAQQEAFCSVCPAGKQMDAFTRECAGCPANSIQPGNTLGCHNCSMQHFTSHTAAHGSVYESQHCLPCQAGKIRQVTSNFSLCEPCPTHYFISPQTQECVLCEFQEASLCESTSDFDGMYFDDCSSVDNFQTGCTCGCRICTLHDFEGIVKNFIVLPGCRAACDDGYKLQRPFDQNPPLACIKNHDLFQQPEFAFFDNGQMKFSARDSSDFTLTPCFQFFALSLSQLASLLHIEPVPPSRQLSPRQISVNNSILSSYITHWWELQDIDTTCAFQCVLGYAPRAALSSQITECVAIRQPPCTTSAVPTFEQSTSCLRR